MSKTKHSIVPAAELASTESVLSRRRWQQGSVCLDAKGNWTLRYRERVKVFGGEEKYIGKRVYLGNQKDMTEKMARRKAEPIISEVNSSSQPKSLITFSQFVDKWMPLAEARYKVSTWRNFNVALRKLLPVFGSKPLDAIDSELVERFLMTTSRSNNHIIVTVLRAIAKDAKRWKYLKNNPFLEIEVPTYKPKDPAFFNAAQLIRILNAAPEPDKTLYWLLAQTGLRIGEALGLTWSAVDLQMNMILVRQTVLDGEIQSGTKSKAANRTIPLSNQLSAHLAKFRATWIPNPSDLVFANSVGNPWHDNSLLVRHLHPLLKTLGIPQAGFHAFRHASATLLDQMQVPMKVRQTRMGHSNPNITLGRYTHQIDDDARDAANLFDQVLAPQLPEKVVAA